jgi:hypothetical protein
MQLSDSTELKKISGLTAGVSELRNETLHNLYSKSSDIKVTKQGKIKYVGHVERIWEN